MRIESYVDVWTGNVIEQINAIYYEDFFTLPFF